MSPDSSRERARASPLPGLGERPPSIPKSSGTKLSKRPQKSGFTTDSKSLPSCGSRVWQDSLPRSQALLLREAWGTESPNPVQTRTARRPKAPQTITSCPHDGGCRLSGRGGSHPHGHLTPCPCFIHTHRHILAGEVFDLWATGHRCRGSPGQTPPPHTLAHEPAFPRGKKVPETQNSC